MMYKKSLESWYKHNIFILILRSFRRNLVVFKNAAREVEIRKKQNKHKQFSISLYVIEDIHSMEFLIYIFLYIWG
jgi:hypothetical protein